MKEVITAAVLGVLIPGGGEFYVGNTAKGVVVLTGAAAALAAGYILTTEDTLSLARSSGLPDCDTPNRCIYDVTSEAEIEKEDPGRSDEKTNVRRS